MIKKRKIPVLLCAILLGLPLAHARQTTPEGAVSNNEFEQGAIGQTPPGWFVGTSLPDSGETRNVYSAQITGLLPWRGWYCACLYSTAPPAPGQFGSLSQGISARAYRGKTVRLTAQMRVEMAQNAPGGAALFVRVDGASGAPLLLTRMRGMDSKLAVKTNWNEYEISAKIPDDAETLNVGVMLIGNGKAYVDSLSLAASGAKMVQSVKNTPPSVETSTPPANQKPISDSGEESANPPQGEDSAQGSMVNTTAPPRRIKVRALPNANFEKGKIGAIPPSWFVPLAVRKVGYWAKITEGGPGSGNHCAMLFRNQKAKTPDSSKLFANMLQTLDATPLRGRKISFSAWLRVQPKTAKDHAQMWLRVDRMDGSVAFLDMMGNKQIRENRWKQYRIVGDIPDDAKTINLGIIYLRDGRAYVDNVALNVIGVATSASKTATNPSETGSGG